MSAGRGKPVHLTGGERRLLIDLIKAEIYHLDAGGTAIGTLSDASEAQKDKFRRLRIRQYRRLANELTFPESTEGQHTAESE